MKFVWTSLFIKSETQTKMSTITVWINPDIHSCRTHSANLAWPLCLQLSYFSTRGLISAATMTVVSSSHNPAMQFCVLSPLYKPDNRPVFFFSLPSHKLKNKNNGQPAMPAIAKHNK